MPLCCPSFEPLQFEDFYEEVFDELSKFGEMEDMYVLENTGDHMVGNVYAKYFREEDAAKCLQSLNGRFYAGKAPLVGILSCILHLFLPCTLSPPPPPPPPLGRLVMCEFSPVTEFREGRCRQYDEGRCKFGGGCNFMHIRRVAHWLHRDLLNRQPHKGENVESSEYVDRRLLLSRFVGYVAFLSSLDVSAPRKRNQRSPSPGPGAHGEGAGNDASAAQIAAATAAADGARHPLRHPALPIVGAAAPAAMTAAHAAGAVLAVIAVPGGGAAIDTPEVGTGSGAPGVRVLKGLLLVMVRDLPRRRNRLVADALVPVPKV